jgi:hypothetical protein
MANCASPSVQPEARHALPIIAVPASAPASASASPLLPLIDASEVKLGGREVPAAFVLDGELGEWGALTRTGAPQHPDGSYVAIAISNDALLVAASLRAPLKEGIWFGLASEPAVLPEPYEHVINGYTISVSDRACEYEAQCCPMGDVEFTGKRLPEARTAKCRAELARHASLVSKLAERYTRQFRFEAGGVWEATASGAQVPVDGARVSWKASPAGAAVEISLPLQALPRMSVPVLNGLQAWAGSAGLPLADVAAKKVPIALPSVLFQPHAELRQALMELEGHPNRLEKYKGFFYGRFGISYQPGDPTHFEILEHQTAMELAPTQITLYDKTAAYGDYEAGELKIPVRHVELSKQGKTHFVQRWDHTRQELYKLDGDLVAAWYDAPHYEWMIGIPVAPVFEAVSISESGKSLVDSPLEMQALIDCQDGWKIAPGSMVVGPGFEVWVWSGSCPQDRGGKRTLARFTGTWRWDRTRKQYVRDWRVQ